MNNAKSTIVFYLHELWRRRALALLACWGVCVFGWGVVMMLPNRYQAQARIRVDPSSVLVPVLRGLAIDIGASGRFDLQQQTLLSRPNLVRLIQLADLDGGTLTQNQRENLLSELATNIFITPGEKAQDRQLFSIGYQHRDPKVAKDVVQALLTMLSESALDNDRTEVRNAQRFLNERIAGYEDQLRAAERRRAEFRQKHIDVLPGDGSVGPRLATTRAEVERVRGQLQDALARRDSLQRELAGVPRFLSVESAPQVVMGGRGGTPTQVRLVDARRNLDNLLMKFTDQHPDVIMAKRELAQAQKDAAAEQASPSPARGGAGRERGNVGHSTVSNALYDQIKVRLIEADTSVGELQRRLAQLEKDQAQLEALVRTVPAVEAQAQDIDRDYATLRKNYDELIQRRESMNLADAADAGRDEVRFRVIEPPELPVKPFWPRRRLLFTGILAVGAAAGVGLAFVLVQMDRSFASVARLKQLGLPVLGSISYVERRPRAGGVGGLAGAAGFSLSAIVLLAAYGALVVSNIRLPQAAISTLTGA